MYGAWTEEKRLPPRALKRRNIRRVCDHSCRESFDSCEPKRGNFQHEVQIDSVAGRFLQRSTRACRVTDETDEDFRARFVRNNVGGAAALDGSYIECAGSENFIDRQFDPANCSQSVEQFVDGG